jgi:hypothetical protein
VFTIPTALLFYGVAAMASDKPARAVRLPRFALAPVAAVFVVFAIRAMAAYRATRGVAAGPGAGRSVAALRSMAAAPMYSACGSSRP